MHSNNLWKAPFSRAALWLRACPVQTDAFVLTDHTGSDHLRLFPTPDTFRPAADEKCVNYFPPQELIIPEQSIRPADRSRAALPLKTVSAKGRRFFLKEGFDSKKPIIFRLYNIITLNVGFLFSCLYQYSIFNIWLQRGAVFYKSFSTCR